MQPLDARRLLPCFDEPNFKAEFSISVQHPEGTTALSNARAEHSRNVERGWTLTLFEKTPKMATYLLALTISDFQHREGQYNGIKVSAINKQTNNQSKLQNYYESDSCLGPTLKTSPHGTRPGRGHPFAAIF
jgi:hypothetical protein